MAEEAEKAPENTREEMARLLETQDKPEQDTPDTGEQDTEAPSEETSAGTAEPSEDTFTTFRLEDVPEEQREYVEKAYKQLQGDYTRKTQSLAEERRQAEQAQALVTALQSEDHRQAALNYIAELSGGEQELLKALGYETDDPTAVEEAIEDLELTPEQKQLKELQDFRARMEAKEEQDRLAREQAEQEAQLDRIDGYVTSQIQALTEEHGEISPEEEQLIVGHALANLPPDQDGMPQIRQAFDAFAKATQARDQRWAKSKETTHVASGGKAATQVPDLDNERERRDYFAEKYAALEAAQQGN